MQKGIKTEERPRLDIAPEYWDQVLDYACWALCIVLLCLSFYIGISLRDTATDSSELSTAALIFSLLGIGTMIGFHYLKKYPHRFNYMIRITPENAVHQYHLALRMIRMVNLIMLLEFIGILIMIYVEATQQTEMNIGLVVIFVMILGFLPVGYYLWKSMEKK